MNLFEYPDMAAEEVADEEEVEQYRAELPPKPFDAIRAHVKSISEKMDAATAKLAKLERGIAPLPVSGTISGPISEGMGYQMLMDKFAGDTAKLWATPNSNPVDDIKEAVEKIKQSQSLSYNSVRIPGTNR